MLVLDFCLDELQKPSLSLCICVSVSISLSHTPPRFRTKGYTTTPQLLGALLKAALSPTWVEILSADSHVTECPRFWGKPTSDEWLT